MSCHHSEQMSQRSQVSTRPTSVLKHCKNCKCCPRHSLFKGHKVIVDIVVLNCQQCNQCLKCQVSSHNKFQKNVIKNCHQKFSSKIVIKNCHQKLSKMSQGSQVSRVTLQCCELSDCQWCPTNQPTKGQGHLLSCSGQLKKVEKKVEEKKVEKS